MKECVITPPGQARVPVVAVDFMLFLERKQITAIRKLFAFSDEEFDQLLLPVIRRLAEYVQMLPASKNYHHWGAGGLFNHSLQVAFTAGRASQAYIFSKWETDPAVVRLTEPRWQVACFLAGLLHDLGKPVKMVRVHDEHGNRWSPYELTLTEWARRLNARWLYLTWEKSAGADFRDHEVAAPVGKVLPESAERWIFSHCSPAHTHMLDFLAGRKVEDSILAKIVKEADSKSVARDTTTTEAGATTLGLGSPIHVYLCAAIKALLEEGAWTCNQPGSQVWFIRDDSQSAAYVVLNQKNAHDLAQRTRSMGFKAVSANRDILGEHLVQSGTCIARTVEEAGVKTSYNFWPMAPEPLNMDGRWTMVLLMARFKSWSSIANELPTEWVYAKIDPPPPPPVCEGCGATHANSVQKGTAWHCLRCGTFHDPLSKRPRQAAQGGARQNPGAQAHTPRLAPAPQQPAAVPPTLSPASGPAAPQQMLAPAAPVSYSVPEDDNGLASPGAPLADEPPSVGVRLPRPALGIPAAAEMVDGRENPQPAQVAAPVPGVVPQPAKPHAVESAPAAPAQGAGRPPAPQGPNGPEPGGSPKGAPTITATGAAGSDGPDEPDLEAARAGLRDHGLAGLLLLALAEEILSGRSVWGDALAMFGAELMLIYPGEHLARHAKVGAGIGVPDARPLDFVSALVSTGILELPDPANPNQRIATRAGKQGLLIRRDVALLTQAVADAQPERPADAPPLKAAPAAQASTAQRMQPTPRKERAPGSPAKPKAPPPGAPRPEPSDKDRREFYERFVAWIMAEPKPREVTETDSTRIVFSFSCDEFMRAMGVASFPDAASRLTGMPGIKTRQGNTIAYTMATWSSPKA